MSLRTPAHLLVAVVSLLVIASPDAADAKGRVRAKKKPAAAAAPFDRDAAAKALESAPLERCARGTAGDGHVRVTFAPSGAATRVVVDEGAFVGTDAEKCIVSVYRRSKVPRFGGAEITVGKRFRIE